MSTDVFATASPALDRLLTNYRSSFSRASLPDDLLAPGFWLLTPAQRDDALKLLARHRRLPLHEEAAQ